MIDRLPDLPNAGYASPKQKATTDLVMYWCRGIERNRPLLLAIVVDGRDKWRKTAGKAWHLDRAGRSTALTVELLDAVFDWMLMTAGPNPAQQLLTLAQLTEAGQRFSYDRRTSTAALLHKAHRTAQDDLRREQRRSGRIYSR